MTPEQLPRIPYAGVVDADGHILEVPDLWEKYLEPQYRDRAVRIRKDDRGLEYLEVNGKPSKMVRNDAPATMGVMDQLVGIEYKREPTGLKYVDNASFGSMDAKERLKRLDIENIECALLYPTLGLLWEPECEDLELSMAYARAYNRWIVDFCSDSNGRLVPIAHIPLGLPDLAEQELRRAAQDGVKGFFVPPFIWSHKVHGHPDHHRVFAAAQELGLPCGIHPSFEPHWAAPTRFGKMTGRDTAFFQNVVLGNVIREGFTSLFQFGVFDKFPELRVVILEIGAGWVGYWLERMDAVYESPIGKSVPLKHKPSAYFRRQCWVSGDPDERALAGVIPFVGEDRFFWASDFPHSDHPPAYIPNLQRLVNLMPESARPKILGTNVRECYRLN
ncbi:MAG: amidohydrolase [Deltaproteobacteria bacterium]|nr:amidohydrolase [Deltaproteobacteria bacterium]